MCQRNRPRDCSRDAHCSPIAISEKCNPLFAAFFQEVPTHRVRAVLVRVQ